MCCLVIVGLTRTSGLNVRPHIEHGTNNEVSGGLYSPGTVSTFGRVSQIATYTYFRPWVVSCALVSVRHAQT